MRIIVALLLVPPLPMLSQLCTDWRNAFNWSFEFYISKQLNVWIKLMSWMWRRRRRQRRKFREKKIAPAFVRNKINLFPECLFRFRRCCLLLSSIVHELLYFFHYSVVCGYVCSENRETVHFSPAPPVWVWHCIAIEMALIGLVFYCSSGFFFSPFLTREFSTRVPFLFCTIIVDVTLVMEIRKLEHFF